MLLVVVVTLGVWLSWLNILTRGLVWAFWCGAGGADMFCNRQNTIKNNAAVGRSLLLLNYVICHIILQVWLKPLY